MDSQQIVIYTSTVTQCHKYILLSYNFYLIEDESNSTRFLEKHVYTETGKVCIYRNNSPIITLKIHKS